MNTHRIDFDAVSRHNFIHLVFGGFDPGGLKRGLVMALCGLIYLAASLPATADHHSTQEGVSGDRRLMFSEDIVAATPLAGRDEILAVGEFGMIALITFDGANSTARLIPNEAREDLMDVAALDDGSALVAGALGNILRFEGEHLEVVQNLGNDSILSVAVQRDEEGAIGTVWAVGGRGIMMKSMDGGKTFVSVTPARVSQPTLTLPHNRRAFWHTGIANVIGDSVKFNARVKGRPVEEGRDFRLTTEDGVLEIMSVLDKRPVPTLSFDFGPGAPFQSGDFSMSAVVFQGDLVTTAGEFGLILQTSDGGKTWTRRAGALTPRVPDAAYWMSGAAAGDTLLLAGASGIIDRSDDRGITWKRLLPPAEEAAVFGTYLGDPKEAPIVSGAVGMLGHQVGDGWELIDRSSLSLYSWLRSIFIIDDNKLLALGGRGACAYRDGNKWLRCRIRLVDENA